MKIKFLAIVMTLAAVQFAHGAGDGISIDKKAHDVIQKRCTRCHGEERINAAFTEGKDMRAIQRDMLRRGARLSGSEQEVLGIFWKKKPQVK